MNGIKLNCGVCQKEFTSRTNFGAHLKTHYNEEFDCFHCHAKFTVRTDIIKHLKTEHKYYLCSRCLVRFKEKDLLKKHKRLHIVKCKICKLKYNSQHFAFHKCDLSDLSDSQKECLERIKSVAYLCFCGESFHCDELLTIHQVTVHLPYNEINM